MRYLRLLAHFWRLNLLVMGQYPLNLTIWFAWGFMYHFASIGILWAMMQQFPTLAGWTFAEMFFLYGLWSVAHGLYALTLGKVNAVSRLVRAGLFDRFLIRPVDPLFQVVTMPQGITVDDLLWGIALFTVAQHQVDLQWTWQTALLLPVILAGGMLIKGGLLLALSTVSFWVVRMEAARLLLETVETEFIRYPLTILPRAGQWVLTTLIPLAFVSFLPAQLLLNKPSPAGALLQPELGLLTPLVGVLTFAAAYAFWRLGLRRYQSTGS